jgi:lantibiotic modifying enzyme
MPRLVRHPSVVRDRAAPFGWTDAASRIADRICSEAIWAGGRCNWVGIGAGDASHDAPDSIHRLASLGPDVYGGTSGIALFLAETYYKTRDHDLRKTALGAMRQAVARADAFSPRATSVGFYGGWTGIAAVAARIARLLGEESLLECARALVRRFASRGRPRESFDLIYGYAGGITPLLALSRMLEDDSARALAEAMGERLVRQASRTAKGCSWTAGAAGRGRHLVGLSHGASGAAYALLELFDEIPNPVYRDTALGAFRFERHWFDPGRGDWRDARWAVGAGGALSPTWCYGAPGIALSRMRGYEATRDEGIRGEAVAALAATRRAVGSALPPAGHDLSLCHGVGGCVDVLLSSCEARSPFAEGANRELAVRGAEGVLRHCLDAVGDWPAAGAPRPVGLMLGLAGMGHLALRAEYPDVPSVLSICKDAWLTSCRARNPRRARHPFAG